MKTKFTLFLLLIALWVNAQTLINENFATQVPPLGWVAQNSATGSETWSYFGANFGAVLFHSSTVQQDEWLITPSLNLSTYSNLYLQLQLRLSNEQTMITDNEADFFVKVSTDNGSTWTNIWDETQFDFTNQEDYISIDISSYVGNANVKFAFQYINTIPGNTANLVQLREVIIGTCPRPTGYFNVNPVIWENIASFSGTYDIEYGPLGFTQGSGTLVEDISGNSYTVPSGDCDSFDYYVRANCGATNSAWSSKRTFNALRNLFISDIQNNTATVNWDSNATSFTLEYGPLNFTSGTGTEITGITSPTYDIQGLMGCTEYTVRVKPSCGTQGYLRETNFITTSDVLNVPYSLPFTETFDESFCEIGYEKIGNSGTAVSGPTASNALLIYNLNDNNTVVVKTRPLNLTQNSPIELSVKSKRLSNNILSYAIIRLVNDNDDVISTMVVNPPAGNATYTDFSSSFLPPATGTYSFEIYYYRQNGEGIFIDDLSVSNCAAILSNIEVQGSNVSMDVYANNNLFDIEYAPSDVAQGSGTFLFANSGNSFNLNNLDECTEYRISIRSNCNGSFSGWETYYFNTNFDNDAGVNVPYSETFEITDNAITGLCNLKWTKKGFGYGYPYIGGYFQSYALTMQPNAASDNHVYSRKIYLESSKTYEISYDYISTNLNNITVTPKEMYFSIGSDLDFNSHQTLIHYNPADNTGLEFATSHSTETITFNPAADGYYHFAFRLPATSEWALIQIDNFEIAVDPLSTNEFVQNKNEVSFSPNPTSTNITFSETISSLEIFNMTGKMVKSFDRENTTFDVENLKPGVYLLKGITKEGEKFTHKLIKK